MRLVKVNDIILNMEHIVLIKGQDKYDIEDNYMGVNVFAYTPYGKEIFLGRCENREDYKTLVESVYKDFGEYFAGEIVEEEEEELWG